MLFGERLADGVEVGQLLANRVTLSTTEDTEEGRKNPLCIRSKLRVHSVLCGGEFLCIEISDCILWLPLDLRLSRFIFTM
jgi:hypothetical protein